jgi:hypothetical protein
VTAPIGAGPFALVTVAVNVTVSPTFDGFGVEASVVALVPAAIASVYARVPVYVYASVATIVKSNVPAADGVPDSAPSEASEMPGGNAPEPSANVYGAMPPLAPSVAAYGEPTAPFGNVGGVTSIVGGVTAIEADVPAMAGFATSFAEIVRVPLVYKVASNVPVPLASVTSAGNAAAGSVLVKCTVPE